MYQEKQTTDIDVLLEKIEEFIEAIPPGKNNPVDWVELAARKKSAQLALNLLIRMFGQFPGKHSYNGAKPELKNSRIFVEYECVGGRPKPGNELLAVEYACIGGRPEPNNTRLDITYECVGGRPKPGNELLAVRYACTGGKPEPKENRIGAVYV